MDENTTSIVNRLGAGSGIDMVQLARDLAEAQFSARTGQLESRNETLEAKISAVSLLRGQLTDLSSALGDRIRSGDLSPTASIGDPSVVGVEVTAGFSPSGSYSLEVSQLAQSQTLVLDPYSSGDDLVGEGTLRIRFGAVEGAGFTEDTGTPPIEIDVAADDTLTTLAAKITAEGGGEVTAYVANGTGGAQLIVKGASGEENGFIIEGQSSASTPVDQPGDLSYLSWDPASDTGQLRQDAQDAVFALDTVELRSESNTVTDLPEGMIFELSSTNVGAPTTIDFPSNIAAISDVMSDLVTVLNDIASEVAAVAAPLGGELGNDSGARAVKRALSSLSTEVVMPNAADGEPSTLGDLGLTVNANGTFSLNDERLSETLAASADGAAKMFTTGVFGVFATIDNMVRDTTATGDPGSLGGSITRYTSQIERNDERLADIAEQQERVLERMTRSFVNADQRVANSQSTLSFIQSQIAIWNADN